VKEKSFYSRSWGKAIKGFCKNSQNFTKASFSQRLALEDEAKLDLKCEERSSTDILSDTTLETQIKENFTKEAFLKLKSYFRGSETRLTEISINENLIQILGYSLDNFCSHILTEGLPEYKKTFLHSFSSLFLFRIFAVHQENNSDFLFGMLQAFSQPDLDSAFPSTLRKTSELETTIKTKTGYVNHFS